MRNAREKVAWFHNFFTFLGEVDKKEVDKVREKFLEFLGIIPVETEMKEFDPRRPVEFLPAIDGDSTKYFFNQFCSGVNSSEPMAIIEDDKGRVHVISATRIRFLDV